MNKCPKCGSVTELAFCPDCGKILEYPSFIKGKPQLMEDLDKYVLDLVTEAHKSRIEISELVGSSKLADTVIRQYFERLAFLQHICSLPSVSNVFDKGGVSLFDLMGGFAEKCQNNECQIAVVGTVKAGKSMFLNAILGQEVASSYPTPETASLTKFRYSENGNYVKVTYYTEEEWKKLWESVMNAKVTFDVRDDKEDFLTTYNELKADELKSKRLGKRQDMFKCQSFDELKRIVEMFTSAKSPEHFFAKEVEVGMSEFKMIPKNVVFVDTPGLNDPVSYRSDITKRYIASANVVLLCVRAAEAVIRADELNEIAILFSEMRYAKDRIFIFATQYDWQDNFLEYWEKMTKPEFLKYLSGKSYFGSKEIADERIIPNSAWYYLLVHRALTDESVWQKGTPDNKSLSIMINKCLGDFTEEDAEAFGRHKYPRERFDEAWEKIELLSKIKLARQIILDGPIKDAENIIVEDLINIYMGIIKEMIEAASTKYEMNEGLVSQSYESDVSIRVREMEVKIKGLQEAHQKNLNLITKILDNIHDESMDIIPKIKKS